jgi:hypothetical protein
MDEVEMRRKFNTVFIICFLAVIGLLMLSCAKQEIASDTADFAGDYTLISINGNSIPGNLTHQGMEMSVLSGSFIINSDGTCSSKTVFVPPSGGEVIREVAATYTRDGSKLTMQWEGAGMTVGIIQDGSFVMDNEGMEFLYKKNE